MEKKKGCCVVIGAGDLTVGAVQCKDEDYVIAVDGGLSYCGILELEPDLLIGDFDSVSEEEKEAIEIIKAQAPEKVIELCPIKDDTDMLAALKLGLEKGYSDFRIYGGTGGRLEHTIANIQCLLFLKEQGAQGYLCDGESMIFVIKDETVEFRETMEGYLSLFSLGRKALGVSISGMKYNLDRYTMRNDFPIGISNEFIGQEATVTVESGELLGIIKY